MKLFIKSSLFALSFISTFFFAKAQTCDGNTFSSPGQPVTCTYTYTATGWEDALGNPIVAPTGASLGQSICILANNSADNFGTIRGTLYVAPGVSYTGSISTLNGTLIAEGDVTLTNTPSMSGTTVYIDTTSTANFPLNLAPGGSTDIYNAGSLNVGGDLTVGGQVSITNYSDAEIIVQGSVSTNNILKNCGLLEVVTGDVSTGGASGLQNLCVTYLHNDLILNGDFYNEGLLIIDGGINFGANTFYNNDMILADNFVLNNNDMIGNDDTSILIVRNNAELQSNATITGHKFFDIDDGGGFDAVCGGCTEDIDILLDVTVPSNINDLTSACNGNIEFNSPTPIAFIDFDGVDDYIDSSLNLSGTTQGTYMAWVKLDSTFTNTGMVLSQGDMEIRVIGGTNNVRVQLNSGTLELPVSTALTLDQWTHIAVVYDASLAISEQYKVYINGEEEGASGHATLASGLTTSTDLFTIGKASSSSINYFKGAIDEVRVFNVSLTEDQLQQIVYQEIQDNSGNLIGKIVPKEIVDFNTGATVLWSSLSAYYPMTDIISYGRTSDFSSNDYMATMHNITSIQPQTAPMPYQTATDGLWTSQASWLHGNVWDIEDEPNNKDWSIIAVKNNITTSSRHGSLGLLIYPNVELVINGDVELYNSWYLKLDGKIDLEGESQLVQGENSDLDPTSSGILERDQQGTADLYTYNYWSAPVGVSNITTNNNNYTVQDVLKDGSNAASPISINWITSGYNGTSGSPIGIADYWIWKYANLISNNYPSWQHIRSNGILQPGEGYTMKGVENSSSSFIEEQNYVFNGKPNNGDITLTLSPGNDYLIGNPYASAIDANEFILDNINNNGGRADTDIINGTLYFWDHFANKSHNLGDYEGGYAAYNLMGGTVAISNDVRINNSGAIGTKLPQQYIPVGQGFFVTAGTGGTVTFKNSQRIFKTEVSDPSLFMRSGNNKKESKNTRVVNMDTREKIRLMFDSPKGYYRQLLVGVDQNATQSHDTGYDAFLIEDNTEDMFWVINDDKYIIQAVDNFNQEQKLPIGVKISQEGLINIKIDTLENVTEERNIYLHDKELEIYHDLRDSNYEVYLIAGEHLDRFEITFFKGETLGSIVSNNDNIEVYFSNNKIVILNPNSLFINSVEMFNILGQSLFKFKVQTNDNFIEYNIEGNKTSGVHIIKLKTKLNSFSKKVIIK
ncbi:LamG-like jellyroll fold domain-containing protein [Pontimicrobium aquaticum]|uniref:T9SS type A sorting domain-containing protein n=1 Tax=Pontimicrobium aquaticum TaxID=2565367 RepID=A0A4U0ESU0_9FLAO|nr:LamG-like jellyroll fold domain-containing protein [Pontimicrobium aquaticum]TJY34678.1 T9SS type A sorting domain-containing protein [Pontimicrobium aquaticum]